MTCIVPRWQPLLLRPIIWSDLSSLGSDMALNPLIERLYFALT